MAFTSRILRLGLVLALSLGAQASAHDTGDSPQVVVQAMTKLVPQLNGELDRLKRGDLVVLDLDNTVFREVQMLGTDEWYSHAIEQRVAAGESKREASAALEGLNVRLKLATQMRLMEPEIAEVIWRLQRRGVFVIGLTARHPRLAALTHAHLRRHAIDFARGEFPSEPLRGDRLPELHNEFLFSGNIAFTDGSPKGLVLSHIILRTGIRPRRVIAVDDRIHHVHTMVEALLSLKIPGRVIQYLRYQEDTPFDAAIAEIQLQIFEREGRFISDAEAARLLGSCESVLTTE